MSAKTIELEGKTLILTNGPVPLHQPGNVTVLNKTIVRGLVAKLERYVAEGHPKKDRYVEQLSAYRALLVEEG